MCCIVFIVIMDDSFYRQTKHDVFIAPGFVALGQCRLALWGCRTQGPQFGLEALNAALHLLIGL